MKSPKLFTQILVVGLLVCIMETTLAQSDFKVILKTNYSQIDKVGDGVYMGSPDYPRDGQAQNKISLSKARTMHWDVINYKGQKLINETFDGYETVANYKLILLFSSTGVGIYNYGENKYTAFGKVDNILVGDGNFAFYDKSTSTYSVYAFPGKLVSKIHLDEAYSLREGMSTMTNRGAQYTKISSKGRYFVVEKNDGPTGRVITYTLKNGQEFHEAEEKIHYGIYDIVDRKFVLPCQYTEIGRIDQKILQVKQDGGNKYVYINWDGTALPINTSDYLETNEFSEGLAAVKTQNDKWGFINSNGSIQIQPVFDTVQENETVGFINGCSVVGQFDNTRSSDKTHVVKWGLIKRNGSPLLHCDYKEIAPIDNIDYENNSFTNSYDDYTFSDALNAYLFTFTNWDDSQGVVTSNGQVLINHVKGIAFSKGCIITATDDHNIKILNLKYNSTSKLNFDKATGVADGLFVYNKDEKTCVANYKGRPIFKIDSIEMLTPYENYMWVVEDNLFAVAYSRNLSKPKIVWKSPANESTKIDGNTVSIKAIVSSYSDLSAINVFVGNERYTIATKSKQLSVGDPMDEISIDQTYPLPNSSQAIAVRIVAENDLGKSVSQRSVSTMDNQATIANMKKRIALLVGNNKYLSQTTIGTCINDVNSMEAALKKSGFDIVKDTDLTIVNFRAKMKSYKEMVQGYNEIVFYYSGHGASIGDIQYLVPVDVNLRGVDDISRQCISMNNVLELQKYHEQSLIIITDACRDLNAVWQDEALTKTDIIKKLLQTSEPPRNSMIWYGTVNGSAALANEGNKKNSLFTSYLLPLLAQPYSIEQMVKMVNINMDEQHEPQLSISRSNLLNTFQFKN